MDAIPRGGGPLTYLGCKHRWGGHFQGIPTVGVMMAVSQSTTSLQGWEVAGLSGIVSPHNLVVKISLKLFYETSFGTQGLLWDQ